MHLAQTSGIHSGRFKLIVAAHPQCPCTRATLNELQRLLCPHPGAGFCRSVLYDLPESEPELGCHRHIEAGLQKLRTVERFDDVGGLLAAKYGAHTSGETLLFDRNGHLLFHGGITGLRGHEGDNRGEDEILRALEGNASLAMQTPVFDCSLGNWSQRISACGSYRLQVSSLRALASTTNLEFRIKCSPDCSIYGDEDRLVQVMTNFLSNAIKFSPSSSRIEAEAQEQGSGQVRFSVRDYGGGIREERVSQIVQSAFNS